MSLVLLVLFVVRVFCCWFLWFCVVFGSFDVFMFGDVVSSVWFVCFVFVGHVFSCFLLYDSLRVFYQLIR